MSPDVAKQATIDTNPGTTVVKTERDDENGVLIYSVELSNGNEVNVDASTGDILSTESDDDD